MLISDKPEIGARLAMTRTAFRRAFMNTLPKIDVASAQPANGIDPPEWETRVDLAAAYRLVALYDMCDLHLNHISARVPGSHEHFLINPFGMMSTFSASSAPARR